MEYIFYVIVIIAKSPWLVLKYLLKHRAALLVVIVCVFGLIVYKTLNRADTPTVFDTPKPVYQKIEPSNEAASDVFISQYGGHIFEVKSYKIISPGNYILTDYYFYDKKKWKHSTIPLPFDEATRGEIKIIHKN